MPQLLGTAPEDSFLGSWLDIFVDFQGPFPESEEGYRYILTYTCKLLRVPILVACRTLKRDEAMQAIGTALLRSLTIPYIIRHDRGQEFGSAVVEEVCTLLGVDHRIPAPYRPQEIGLGETVHREVNKQVGLILSELSTSYPQEWAKTLDLVFYVMMTSPLQATGFCARDLDRCWSMRDHLERELVRLEPGALLPIEEWTKKLFERYKLIRGLVSRYLASESSKRAEAFDRGLHPHEWALGDKVFRKESKGMPSKFLPRNSGPYRISQVLSKHKVILTKLDGEAAFSYPVPTAELIFVPKETDHLRRSS